MRVSGVSSPWRFAAAFSACMEDLTTKDLADRFPWVNREFSLKNGSLRAKHHTVKHTDQCTFN